MPSFYRTDHDVRLVFGAEPPRTPEDDKQRDRLLALFRQTLRRSGSRGSFFYHRRAPSLGGRPVLILEPQGPVDRGIFQGGLSRFGETLSGTFRVPESGHLVLETVENVSDASVLKYSRDVRALIADLAGMMVTGGDERVQILTPRLRAEAARDLAQQRREAAQAARHARAQADEEEAPPAPAPDADALAHVLRQPSKVATPTAPAQDAAVQRVTAALAAHLPAWLEQEGELHDLDAALAEGRVALDALEADEARVQALVQRLGPVRDAGALRVVQAEVVDDPLLGDVAALSGLEAVWDAVRAKQRALLARRAALRPQQEAHRTRVQQRRQGAERLEQARRALLRSLAEEAREALRLHGEQPEARALLAVAVRLDRAEEALHWLAQAVAALPVGAEDGDVLSAAARQGALAHQAVDLLRRDAAVLRGLGAAGLLVRLARLRPELAPAWPALERLAREG